jgi:hypothetical protein
VSGKREVITAVAITTSSMALVLRMNVSVVVRQPLKVPIKILFSVISRPVILSFLTRMLRQVHVPGYCELSLNLRKYVDLRVDTAAKLARYCRLAGSGEVSAKAYERGVTSWLASTSELSGRHLR